MKIFMNIYINLPDGIKPSRQFLYFFKNSDERFIFYKLLEDMLPERQSIIK